MATLRFYTEKTSELLYVAQYCSIVQSAQGILFRNSLFSNQYELHASPSQFSQLLHMLEAGTSYAVMCLFWKEEGLEKQISLPAFIAMGFIE